MSRPTSQMSATSRSMKSRQQKYRAVSRSSNVDESLFGTPSQQRAQQGNRGRGPAPSGGLADFFSGGTEGKRAPPSGRRSRQPETMQIVTKDGIRNVRVPRDSATVNTIVLSQEEYARIRQNSVVRTKTAMQRERLRQKEIRQQAEDASHERRNRMAERDLQKTQGLPMNDLDLEAKMKSEYVLQDAQRKIEEEEDEIKKLNEFIHQAKTYAIRDAQLAEREAHERALREEEAKLDALMEEERVAAVEQMKEKEEMIRRKRLEGAQVIRDQITYREQQRLLEEELHEQEQDAMLRQIEEMKADDEYKLQQKKLRAAALIEEVAKHNDEAQRLKKLMAEAEIEEEQRMAEFLAEKARKEEEIEQQKIVEAREREVETQRLRSMQEKMQDKAGERAELEAKRVQQEVERQRRRQEKEANETKARRLEELRVAREAQIKAKEQFMALQAKQDREEFERVLRAQKEVIAFEERKVREHQEKMNAFREDVHVQIEHKKKERLRERRDFFDEGAKLDDEAQARRRRLDEIKQRKLQELQAAGIADKYLVPVKRFVQNGQKQTFST